MDPITLIIFITVGGVLIGGGVHFIPVGGAPAAMSTATGVGTGTAMLAIGAGLTGLITAAAMTDQPFYIIALAGSVGTMLMMGITMFISNMIYVFGIGVIPVSAKVEVDPITGKDQEKYVTPGTEGHGVPTVCYVSGIIGGLLGGAGGGLIYFAVKEAMTVGNFVTVPIITVGLAAMVSIAIFFINAVVSSYNIGGTIEGFHDPKFKRIGTGILACAVVSIVMGMFTILFTGVVL